MQVEKKTWKIYLIFAMMMILSMVAGSRQMQQWLSTDATPVTLEESSNMEISPKVALTFDDGPHPLYTKKLLNGLRERGVTATFFVVGENISGREEILKQIWQDGHLIGNHTYEHVDISKLSVEEACVQLEKTNERIKEVIGVSAAYVRAPFGNWADRLDCETTMIPVKWSVDSLDWTTKNVDQIVKKVVENVEDNDIILLHDYYESSVEAALRIVDILQEKGYVFVTVEELMLE